MQLASTHSTTLSHQQKVISILLIMLMSVLPMLTASASLFQCQHTSSLVGSSIVGTSLDHSSVMSDTQTSASTAVSTAIMSDMHDCCEEVNSQCDCDNGQVGSSLVNTITNVLPTHKTSTFKLSIQPLLYSKVADSLYRPPITIL